MDTSTPIFTFTLQDAADALGVEPAEVDEYLAAKALEWGGINEHCIEAVQEAFEIEMGAR